MTTSTVTRNAALHATRTCRWFAVALGLAAVLIGSGSASAQTGWLRHGDFIGAGDLPPDFAVILARSGGRMTAAPNANVTVAGTLTDGNGSRPGQITVQAPGFLRYQEGKTRTITFDGTSFKTKAGSLSSDDTRVAESLLASFPDALLLQLARPGGLVRRIGGGFRTDDGTAPDYQGPWWTVYGFSPAPWTGLSRGQPLQQEVLIAIDEGTGMLAEVRVVENVGAPDQKVTQTQFSGWYQQAGQWFPGAITRLENGQQVLSFRTQQAGVGPQSPAVSITAP